MTADDIDVPVITVVLPVHNGERTIAAQLQALAAQDFDRPWELVVVDNLSTDRTAEIVAQWRSRLPSARLVPAYDARGVSHARNVGCRAARADEIAICDADDVVTPGWLSAMHACLKEHDLVQGALREDVLNPPEVLAYRTRRPDRLVSPLGHLPYAMGANVGLRATTYATTGGWDESYLAGADDVDFSWRAQGAGLTLGYCREAVVDYRHRAGLHALWRQFYGYGFNRALLWSKHRDNGLRRPGPRVVLAAYGWLLVHLPDLLRPGAPRARWVKRGAGAYGRLRGSLHHRKLYL